MEFKVGQKLFFVSRVGIEKVTVENIDDHYVANEGFIQVKHHGTVDYNGKEICPTYGTSYQKNTNLFLDLETAVAFVKAKEEERYNSYLAEIKNLKDLIEFPIKNSFSDGDGCADGLIIKAYRTRAEELLGIKIESESDW